MVYTFAQFDPRPQGAEHNDAIFEDAETCVLGIEVTVGALAAKCSLGNLDHHGAGSTAETPSACEQALNCSLPPEKATLATVRADADSVAAMAVLASRQEGRTINTGIAEAIGMFDRLGPSAGRPDDRVIAVGRVAADFKRPLPERTAWVQAILEGSGDLDEVATLVQAHDAEIEEARAASEISVEADGRISVVVSTNRHATQLGYEHAPVVVACNPEMPVDPRDPSQGSYKKFTICRYDSHVAVDIAGALRELNELEEGWGGRADIGGSPQGVSSELTLEQVVEVVKRHLT